MAAYLMVKEIDSYFQIKKILLMSVRLPKRMEKSPTKGPADDLENIRRPGSGYLLPQGTVLYTTLLSFVMTPRNWNTSEKFINIHTLISCVNKQNVCT